MRLATRNLCNGGPRGYTAVHKTLSLLRPDVLFLQECCDPARYAGCDDYHVFWSAVPHEKWGSAILVKKSFEVEPLVISVPDFDGWLCAATLRPNDVAVHLVNIHMPSLKGRSYAFLAQQFLDSLAPQIAQGSLIVGGDWNVSILAPLTASPIDLKGSAAVRKKLADLRLVNAWSHLHPAEEPPRTLRYRFQEDSLPFHIDGFFLTPDLVPRLQSCEVLETEAWLDSDHNPVVMELTL